MCMCVFLAPRTTPTLIENRQAQPVWQQLSFSQSQAGSAQTLRAILAINKAELALSCSPTSSLSLALAPRSCAYVQWWLFCLIALGAQLCCEVHVAVLAFICAQIFERFTASTLRAHVTPFKKSKQVAKF